MRRVGPRHGRGPDVAFGFLSWRRCAVLLCGDFPPPAFPPEAQGHCQQSREGHRDPTTLALPQLRHSGLPAVQGQPRTVRARACPSCVVAASANPHGTKPRGGGPLPPCLPPRLPPPRAGCEVRSLSGVRRAALSVSLPSWPSAHRSEPGPPSRPRSHPQLYDS